MNSLNTLDTSNESAIETPATNDNALSTEPRMIEVMHMCQCVQPVIFVIRYRLMPVMQANRSINPADAALMKPEKKEVEANALETSRAIGA